MANESERNLALLKQAYKNWSDTLGGNADEWMSLCADTLEFGSQAEGTKGAEYLTEYKTRDALKEYFAGLARDWQMIEYAIDHFVTEGDRVVALGRCGWRYRKTGKVVWTKKADSWRFAGGKIVEFYEYYDTAQVRDALA